MPDPQDPEVQPGGAPPTGWNGAVDTPDAPPDHVDAGLEGNLGQLTDRQWLEGHLTLIASGALPAAETAFLYDPDRHPAGVTAGDLTEDGQPRG